MLASRTFENQRGAVTDRSDLPPAHPVGEGGAGQLNLPLAPAAQGTYIATVIHEQEAEGEEGGLDLTSVSLGLAVGLVIAGIAVFAVVPSLPPHRKPLFGRTIRTRAKAPLVVPAGHPMPSVPHSAAVILSVCGGPGAPYC